MKYMVNASITVGVCIEVEADSPDKAREKAFLRPVASLAEHRSRPRERNMWYTDDLSDATVEPITSEVVSDDGTMYEFQDETLISSLPRHSVPHE